MKNLLLMMAVTSTFVACDQRDRPYNSTANRTDAGTTTTSTEVREVQEASRDKSVTLPAAPNYDNTIRNRRDRDGSTLTSGDQSESEADRSISQKVRQAIMADDNLSTNAKNVKVITVNGVVTLRGPVASVVEKESVGKKASGVQGVSRVDNQIEVTRNY